MNETLTIAMNLLSYGSIIVLVVLGLGVIFSMMNIFNFAHGEFIMLGGCTVYLFNVWGLPVWLGIVAAPFVVGIVGLGLERAIIHRVYGAPIFALLGTYAICVKIGRASCRERV